ncbi:MAG TPA: trypsin-like peptidase domain-containing protein [Methylomirabilota bacterium]|nr:trypsin-like peptidase domain-containing protein [Methylomirabilota bacterium]
MQRMIAIVVVAVVVGLVAAATAEAGKPIDRPERAVVGHGRDLSLVPDLGRAVQVGDERIWVDSIVVKDAFFLKPHFVGFNLRAGDALVVRSATGWVVETITGRGPKDLGTFWGLSARGEELHLEFHMRHHYAEPPFTIDLVLVGDVDPFAPPGGGPESICPPSDFEDVICYQSDPGKWANVQASVGLMNVGSSPISGLWCSGSNVSPNNYVLSNDHCITSQAECDTTEFVFRYYNQNCGSGPTTPDWQSFRCDDIVASSPYVSCEATLTSLDFTLNSVIGDPAATFGYAEPDPNPVTDGEGIYIIQHPAGRPHEITHGDGTDVDADAPNLRYYNTLDTEGGSSGSPIYRDADDKLIGLHHCGGCTTPGVGNRGMMMSDIYPLIQDYLCSDILDVRAADTQGLAEVSGNGNAVLEPGESWQFTPLVRNAACTDDALGVTADIVLNAASAGPVAISGGVVSFGDVPAGAVAPSQMPVIFDLDGSAACGGDVIFDLANLTAANGGPWPGATALLTVPVGEVVWESVMLEDFAGGIPATWTVVHNGTATGPAATWTTDNPGGRVLALTEPFAIVDSDEAGTGVTHDEELITAPVDCTGHEQVELRFKHDFNQYSTEICDVDVRSGATGGAWVNVASFTGGDTSGLVTVDITAQAVGQNDVEVRFHYYNASYEWWWAVDDVEIAGGTWVCGASDVIFADDFETGDALSWDLVVP